MKSVFLCEPVDNVFEGRTSLVLCLDPQENEAEDSLWEFEPEDPSKFRFGSGNLKEIECYPVRELARSCTRKICCLEHPAFFVFDSTRSLLFISEPKRNRIGIFDPGYPVLTTRYGILEI